MEFQQKDHHNQKPKEIVTSDRLMHYIVICFALIVFLAYLPFRTLGIQINCIRSNSGGHECILVRKSLLLEMSPVIIPEPVAVDIIEQRGRCSGCITYRIEMRSTEYSYAVPLYSTENSQVAKNISSEVNHFLLYSDKPSFLARYP